MKHRSNPTSSFKPRRAKTLGFTRDELYTLAYASRARYHKTAALCGALIILGSEPFHTAADAAAEYALTARLTSAAFSSPCYAPGF